MIIYKVTNLVNQKIYIGQSTKTLKTRKSGHYREARSSKKKSVYFHNALLKYKESDFQWEILEEVSTQKELDLREQYWIQFYHSNNSNFGYNLKAGGQLNGGINSQSTKNKIGEATKLRWKNLELAQRMLKGLQKGTETQKQKALVNFKKCICINCGKEFIYRPKDVNGIKPKYCSKQCSRKILSKCINKANQVNKELQKIKDLENKQKINNWCKEHIKKYKNITFNKLTPIFNELLQLTGLQDIRSILRIYGFKSRKKFVQELLKIYAEQV